MIALLSQLSMAPTSRFRGSVLLVVSLCLSLNAFAQLPRANREASLSTPRLELMDTAIAESIRKRELPGAVVLVARKSQVVWRKAYGFRAIEPAREPMT